MSRKRPRSNKTERRMVEALDNLSQFEEFQEQILPKLREALAQGATAQDIYKLASAAAAARAVTIAVRGEDGQALAAIKEVLDRSVGKPTEKREVKHELANLPDDQLDALLDSKLLEADEAEDSKH